MFAFMNIHQSISVVLCTYNGEKFITEQIDSILLQTYAIEELIIIDDASTDATFTKLQSIAQTNPLIKLYRNEQNIGYNQNFEQALQLANGTLIAIADQDDVWVSTKLEKMVDALKPGIPLIYCNSIRFTDTIPMQPVPNKKNRRIAGSNPFQLAMFNTVSGHAMLLRKEFIPIIVPFPIAVYYDWWIALHAMVNGGIQYFPEILVYQRVHEQNITIKKGLTERTHRTNYRAMLNLHLKQFATIANFSENQRQFFTRFSKLWNRSVTHKINFRLFIFLLKNHPTLFYYKVRIVPFFSAFKVSFLFAFRR